MGERKENIAVVGAGIVGLTNAWYLLEAGHNVTVFGKHLPGSQSIEYTSSWAGAMWRTHAAPEDHLQQRWDTETYKHWMKVVDSEQHLGIEERCGIVRLPALNCWDSLDHPEIQSTPTKTPESIWFGRIVRDFKVVKEPSALPEGVAIGVTYSSFSVDINRYLRYVSRKIRELGGDIIESDLPEAREGDAPDANIPSVVAELKTLNKQAKDFTTVLFCPGLGARKLLPDPAMFPIRGQTHLVRGVGKVETVRQGTDPDTGEPYVSYMVPRPESGVSLLGGCKEAGNWNEASDEQLKAKILARARSIGPELLVNDEFEIIAPQVGFRPGRKGGVRIEKTEVDGMKVVLAYGHAGAGFQNSVGCARDVVRLIES